MELSLFLSKLIGLYFLFIGLYVWVRRPFMQEVVEDFYKSPALILFTGVLSLVLGLAILIGHPVYELSWRGVITLIGLLFLVQSFLRLFAHDLGKRLAQKCLQEGVYQSVSTILMLIGLFLAYHGWKK